MGTSVATFSTWSNDSSIGGAFPWINPDEAQFADAVYTTRSLSSGATSNYLKGVDPTYDVPIPDSATITAVHERIKYQTNHPSRIMGASAGLVIGGVIGPDGASASLYSFGVDTTVDTAAETWTLPTVAQAKATNFGVATYVMAAIGPVTALVDQIQLVVEWEAPLRHLTNVTYLGRTKLGKKLSLVLQSINGNGTPTQPDAAPYADIYAGTTLVETVRLPIVERYKVNWLFGVDLFLGGKYSTGQHMIVYRWLLSGAKYQAFAYFEILAGGTVAGPVVAIAEYQKPEAHYLIQQTEDGTLNYGRNPQL